MLHEEINIQAGEFTATLTTYIIPNDVEMNPDRKRPMIIICPGGGYEFVSNREAEPVAIQLNAMGFHACVLRYNTSPAVFPTALCQLARSVATVRSHAKEWNVKEDKIIVAGFSAGGHLAASLSVMWQESFLEELMEMPKENYKPNGMILSYPVITSGEYAHRGSFVNLLGDRYGELLEKVSLEKQVSVLTPPAFLWHTFEDDLVPVENSLLFANALRANQVPFELHIYPRGGHGLALANEETKNYGRNFGIQEECQSWISLAGTWINKL